MAVFLSLTVLLAGPAALADDDHEDDDRVESSDGQDGGGWGDGGSGSPNYNWGDTGSGRGSGSGFPGDAKRDHDKNEDENWDFLTEDVLDAQKDLMEAQLRLQGNPDDPEAVAKLAEAYAKLGQWDQVARLAPQLEAAATFSGDAAEILAALQIQQGDLQGAQAQLQSLLSSGQAGASTYELLGLIHEKEDDWHGAFNQYEQAAQLDPSDPKLMKKLGKAYRKLLDKVGDALEKMYGDVELDDIPVFVNGRQLTFQDQGVSPQIIGDRTMVPVRRLAEALGAQVSWDPATRSVTITTPAGVTVTMTVYSTQAFVNGQPVTLDVAPVIVNDRTLFPARFIAEQLGYQVGWDDEYRIVTVTSPTSQTSTGGTGGTVEANRTGSVTALNSGFHDTSE